MPLSSVSERGFSGINTTQKGNDMDSLTAAISGEFNACWRIDIDDENETRIIMNATGWDDAMAQVERAGFTIDQIINYTVC